MRRHLFLALSNPAAGRESDFHEWYGLSAGFLFNGTALLILSVTFLILLPTDKHRAIGR